MSRHDSPKEVPLSKERLEEAEHWWAQDRRPAGPWTPNQTWNLICDLVREIKRLRKKVEWFETWARAESKPDLDEAKPKG